MTWQVWEQGARLVAIQQLEERKAGLVKYAHMKLDSNDFHGCADACMDIRELDAKLELLKDA